MQQMKNVLIAILLIVANMSVAQDVIPLDTTHWEISDGASYLYETYKGKNAIYLKGGVLIAKDMEFENGTIEFDVYLKKEHGFPGVSFRAVKDDAEQFYLRPHLPGKADANQVLPVTNGIASWQLYFGPKYSFPYEYKYDDWTHVRIDVNGDRAQVYLDYSPVANLSWRLFHPSRSGGLVFRAGNRTALHLADIKINTTAPMLSNFSPVKRKAIEGIIPEWEISDKFEKSLLSNPNDIAQVADSRTWGRSIKVEEGVAANIARVQKLRDGQKGETVFARIKITSDKDQIKRFHFGYSDDVIAILNNKAIYSGTNKWRSRDYRYLGTVGLFDAIYLDLKKGENTLLMAVSENFGGWLITGKIEDMSGVKISLFDEKI